MTASAEFMFADYVCPSLATIISFLTFLAPVKSLRECMKCGSLGPLNPTPWAFMTGNTLGWVAYSFITSDLFVFFANVPGLIISVWLNVGAMQLQFYGEYINYMSIQLVPGEEEDADKNDGGDHADSGNTADHGQNGSRGLEVQISNIEQVACKTLPEITSHELLVVQVLTIWVVILSIASFVPMSTRDMQMIVGISVNIFLIFFFAAPLSTIVAVIRTKNSASIHSPTMVMNTTNAIFWCIYGLAKKDPFILLPNGLGLLFGVIQICLCIIYSKNDSGLSGDGVAVAGILDDEEHSRKSAEAVFA